MKNPEKFGSVGEMNKMIDGGVRKGKKRQKRKRAKVETMVKTHIKRGY